jgi:hypothetical protein
MSTPPPSELLRAIAELCEIFPELRIGQLLCNLTTLIELASIEMAPDAVWLVEDDLLLDEAARFLIGQLERLGLRPPSFLAQQFVQASEGAPLTNHRRLNLLIALRDCGLRYPQLRFGQMVADLVALAKKPATTQDWAGAIWDIEDEELLDAVQNHLGRPAERLDQVPLPDDWNASAVPTTTNRS